MKWRNPFPPIIAVVLIGLNACDGGKPSTAAEETEVKGMIENPSKKFNSDSAFDFISKQVAFGYRIPGTKEHKACAEWLFGKLNQFCDTAYFPKGSTTTHEGKSIPVYNLIGSFRPNATRRILLASHWDSRPIADNGPIENRRSPIDGANDGASGVAVLLEIARNIDSLPEDVGIDIVFFDAEDLGISEVENSFCLGSQYWAKNAHVPRYTAHFGILLDMVGGKKAKFYWEGNSKNWGSYILSHVWTIAQELGFGSRFITESTAPVIDDHAYVYEGTQIPMIDIIDYHHSSGFPEEWHTVNDNLENIHKPTLNAVGITLENTLLTPPPSLFY